MIFQVELLSGGVFTVYAVDARENMFLIYRDDQWTWIGMEKCRPYTYPRYCTTNFTDGGRTT